MTYGIRARVAALGVVGLAVGAMAGSCQTDAHFESGANDDVFGTLIDDRGSFEFVRNPDTGNIQVVNADNGTITPPTDGQDLSISRDDGSSITLQPAGENDVLVVVREDPVVENIEFTISREALGDDLGGLVRPNGTSGLCEGNRDFLDVVCELTIAVDVQEVVEDIREDLMGRGEDPPDSEVLTAVLLRYFVIVVDCCLAWDELRFDLEIDPCTP